MKTTITRTTACNWAPKPGRRSQRLLELLLPVVLLSFNAGAQVLNANSFAPAIVFSLPNGDKPGGVAVGDLDGDGKPDMVVADFRLSDGTSGSTVSVYRNISAAGVITPGSFAAPIALSVTGPFGPEAVAIGDVDGDGKPDVVVHAQNGSLWVFLNTSTPGNLSFGPGVGQQFGSPFTTHTIVIRDLDGDGKADVILAGYPGLTLLQNKSTPGNLSLGTPVFFTIGVGSSLDLAVGDLDGDGKPDIAVIGANSTGTLCIFRNTSTPGTINSSSLAARVDLPTGTGMASTIPGAAATAVVMGDFNGDGKLDVAVNNQFFPSSVAIFENDSSVGNIVLVHKADFSGPDFVSALAAADLDGDGKLDLASDSVSILQNIGVTGQPFTADSFAHPLGFSAFAPVPDISVPQSDGSFGFPVDGGPWSIAIADVDGDGLPDIIATSQGGSISILRNTAAQCAFTTPFTPPALESASSLDGSTIGLRYDQQVSSSSALNTANYLINGGAVTVNSLAMMPDQQTILLNVTGLSAQPNTAFTLAASGILSCAGMVGGGTATGHVHPIAPLSSDDIGLADPFSPFALDRFRPSAVYSVRDGSTAVTAGGNGQLGFTADSFNFVHQAITGDFDVKVRVFRLDILHGTASAGLVVREDLTPESRNFSIQASPANGDSNYHAAFRDLPDGSRADGSSSVWGDNLAAQVHAAWPDAWCRLTRVGQTFTAYVGSEGVNWFPVAQTTVSAGAPFAATAYVGLCTSSGTLGGAITAEFDLLSGLSVAPPIINCPGNIVLGTDAGSCSATAAYTVTATGSGGNPTVVCNPPSGSQFPKGTTTVNCTATDSFGNHSGCTFTVTVNDSEKPVIICPANIVAGCDVNLLTPVSFSATATDNCDPSPRVTYSIAPGSGFPVGTTSVNCSATDASGNQSSCAFTVTRAPLDFAGFLSPIGGSDASGGSFANPLRTFKLNSTIPVKFTAACGGSALLSGIHRLQVTQYTTQTTAADPIDATPTDAATTGDQFRLSGGQWQFNLDTKATGMSSGIWLLVAHLSDGTTHSAWIQIK